VRGDFGYSTSNSEDVVTAIVERLPATLLLMGRFLRVVAGVVGVTFGIIAAVKPYSWIDYVVTTFAFFGQSMPVFWFALILQLAFAVNGHHGVRLPLRAAVGGHQFAATTSISATASPI
jgi:peptide/nickel transport system permease protein